PDQTPDQTPDKTGGPRPVSDQANRLTIGPATTKTDKNAAKAAAKQAKQAAREAQHAARQAAKAERNSTGPVKQAVAATVVLIITGGAGLYVFQDDPRLAAWTSNLRKQVVSVRSQPAAAPNSTDSVIASLPPSTITNTELEGRIDSALDEVVGRTAPPLPVQPIEGATEPTLTIAELEALGNAARSVPSQTDLTTPAQTPANTSADQPTDQPTEVQTDVQTDVAAAPSTGPLASQPEATRIDTARDVAARPSPAIVLPPSNEIDLTAARLAAPPPLALPAELEALRSSAATGNRQAQHDLGAHFAAGRLVEQDFARAAYWFQEAAIRGVDNAQYNLGVLFQQGLGVAPNPTLAVQWYERAADNGHVEAKYNMGVAYADGIGVERDIVLAVRWFEQAAAEGISRAAFNLGVMYEVGMIGSPDLAVARQWYRQAATSGEQDAINAIDRLDQGTVN
ncbi:MAG: hypothetical protein AAF556_03580, partial [Pseudomonadota bacterium]